MCGPRVSPNALFFYVYHLFYRTSEELEMMISQILKHLPGNLHPVSHAAFASIRGSGATELAWW